MNGRGLAVSEYLDIPYRWLAEESAVLATELTDAFIAHFVRGRRGIDSVPQHPLPCCLQPELLLILQGTHGG